MGDQLKVFAKPWNKEDATREARRKSILSLAFFGLYGAFILFIILNDIKRDGFEAFQDEMIFMIGFGGCTIVATGIGLSILLHKIVELVDKNGGWYDPNSDWFDIRLVIFYIWSPFFVFALELLMNFESFFGWFVISIIILIIATLKYKMIKLRSSKDIHLVRVFKIQTQCGIELINDHAQSFVKDPEIIEGNAQWIKVVNDKAKLVAKQKDEEHLNVHCFIQPDHQKELTMLMKKVDDVLEGRA